ncbi:serine/threonine protein kinase [Nocardia nova]|uniref:non-specific serine/threonine protein kinase n=1 Tax=Nocardia nova TaxID=37330 RepID=A0A2S5ZWQ5_9NOCA|nr:serine/threonine protein kinase [Nocardia nova]
MVGANSGWEVQPVAQTLVHGQVFAGYRIERLLGAGGMGEVYLAHDRDLPRYTALKVLNPAFAGDEDARHRFLREADTIARLSHPNIVTVYARGQEGDRLWMAMQYIEGTDVAAVLRNGPMHPEHAGAIVTEAAKALDFAHRAGVLHRDVKPANILLAQGDSKQVFLADFGIAKILDHTNELTRSGEVHASLRYAAPEQLDPGMPVDQRVDVYALGCTLYHMLTGAPPYPGASPAQLIHAHLNLPLPAASQQNPWLPAAFDAVIARATAKNPQERFSSCGELAAAAHYASAASASRAPHTAPASGSGRRWGWIVAAVVAVLMVLGAGGAGAFVLYHNRSTDDAQRSADAARDAACAFGRTVSTYDYDKFAAYQTAVLDATTGDLKTQMQSTMPTLQDVVTQSKARSHVSDAQCFVKTSDADRAEVAAIITQALTNNTSSTERSSQISVLLTMQFVDGRWLAAKLEQLAAPK